jgi:hypothetical protein
MEQKVSYGVAHFGGTEKKCPFLCQFLQSIFWSKEENLEWSGPRQAYNALPKI